MKMFRLVYRDWSYGAWTTIEGLARLEESAKIFGATIESHIFNR